MRILLLANIDSSHTLKWARSLSQRGIEVGIWGLSEFNPIPYSNFPDLKIFCSNFKKSFCNTGSGSLKKILYLWAIFELKKVINEFQPDLVHSHYISSYGLLGSLTGFRPHITSVWGSDIFEVPKKSFLNRLMIKICLKRSDAILSTSKVMADEIRKYTKRQVEVTPFGIDLQVFKRKEVGSIFSKDDLVVGTIKTLDSNYGIDVLVRAFRIVKDKYPNERLKLLLVGGGPLINEISRLVEELNLTGDTVITGPVSYDCISDYHNMLTIPVFVSNSESFGVAVIEANACERPVVVSNVGGLPEVVVDFQTGIIVPPRDPRATADAIELLLTNPELRAKLGDAGRKRVEKIYNWEINVSQMLGIYGQVLRKSTMLAR